MLIYFKENKNRYFLNLIKRSRQSLVSKCCTRLVCHSVYLCRTDNDALREREGKKKVFNRFVFLTYPRGILFEAFNLLIFFLMKKKNTC